jgi:DNA-binding NtrC family response regulator
LPAFRTDQSLVPGSPVLPGAPIVLVVDQDPDAGQAIATDLRRAGMRARTALTADLALDCCHSQPFDAAVFDRLAAEEDSDRLLDEAGPGLGLAVIVSAAKPSALSDVEKRHPNAVFALKRGPIRPSQLVEVVQAAVTETRRQRQQDPTWDREIR